MRITCVIAVYILVLALALVCFALKVLIACIALFSLPVVLQNGHFVRKMTVDGGPAIIQHCLVLKGNTFHYVFSHFIYVRMVLKSN